MGRQAIILTILAFFFAVSSDAQPGGSLSGRTVVVHPGYSGDGISGRWRDAIESRMTRSKLDSMVALRRPLNREEIGWKTLIESKSGKWNSFRDSISAPFRNAGLHDTIYVMVGFLGVDDGFTYGYQTVCLDVTALNREYGSASLPENDPRIDRLFAHEFSHLLHKDWARRKNLRLESFRDSVLWECLYEGIGMYRSLSSKWFPVEGILPEISRNALEELYPIFVDRLTRIDSGGQFTDEEKLRLTRNLSRGPVDKKWGALPVALWLALEANGNERNLAPWIDAGPGSVIRLAKKYLTQSNRKRFLESFPN